MWVELLLSLIAYCLVAYHPARSCIDPRAFPNATVSPSWLLTHSQPMLGISPKRLATYHQAIIHTRDLIQNNNQMPPPCSTTAFLSNTTTFLLSNSLNSSLITLLLTPSPPPELPGLAPVASEPVPAPAGFLPAVLDFCFKFASVGVGSVGLR